MTLLKRLNLKRPEIIESIQSTGKLEEDIEKSLIQLIEDYKK